MHLNVSWRVTGVVLGLFAALLACYFLFPQVRGVVNATIAILTAEDARSAIEGLRDYLLSIGIWAPVVSALMMIFQSVAAPLPAFIVTFANGLLFGWAWGALLSWSSAMAGAALCFWIARGLGRPVVEKLVGGSQALEVSDLFFARYGSAAILIARLLPFVSFDIISYGAGLTPVSFRRFVIATGIGQLPATLLYSYLGQTMTGSIKALFWAFSITAVVFIAGWLMGPSFVRRLRADRPGEAQSQVRRVTE